MNVLGNNLNITKGLLNNLSEQFPNKIPVTRIEKEDLAFLQGQQSVIHYLTRLFEEAQEEN